MWHLANKVFELRKVVEHSDACWAALHFLTRTHHHCFIPNSHVWLGRRVWKAFDSFSVISQKPWNSVSSSKLDSFKLLIDNPMSSRYFRVTTPSFFIRMFAWNLSRFLSWSLRFMAINSEPQNKTPTLGLPLLLGKPLATEKGSPLRPPRLLSQAPTPITNLVEWFILQMKKLLKTS